MNTPINDFKKYGGDQMGHNTNFAVVQQQQPRNQLMNGNFATNVPNYHIQNPVKYYQNQQGVVNPQELTQYQNCKYLFIFILIIV